MRKEQSDSPGEKKSPLQEALDNAGFAIIGPNSVTSWEENTFGETIVVIRPLVESEPQTYFLGPNMVDSSFE